MSDYVKTYNLKGKRCEDVLKAAYKLFSERSIESVNMTDIADEANIGVATIYRYFGTKKRLVSVTGALHWFDLFQDVKAKREALGVDQMKSIDQLDFSLGLFIYLFEERKDLLRFTANFDQYLRHERMTEEELAPYCEAIDPFYEQVAREFGLAIAEGDVSPLMADRKHQLGGLLTLLAAAQKFAAGGVYTNEQLLDGLTCLRRQRRMYMHYLRLSATEGFFDQE